MTTPIRKARRRIAAIEFTADLGWTVFPAPPGTKKSYRSKKDNGQRWGASNNPDEVERWFAIGYPDANVAVVTGRVSGIFVVESDTVAGHGVDGKASLRALEAKHGKLPETRMAISPTGSEHYYFNHPGGDLKVWGSNSKLAPGVDVKGDGNMVLAPPSVKPGVGTYRWLNYNPIADAPAWLLELVCRSNAKGARPAKSRSNKKPRSQKPVVVGDDARQELEDACAIVAATEQGSRNDELNKQAFFVGQLVGADRLDETLAREQLTEAAEAAGLGTGEIEATITSGLTAGMAQPRLLVKETWRQQLENEAAAAIWSADGARRQLRRVLRRIIARLDDDEAKQKVWALRAATGLGKTMFIIELIAPWLRADPRRVLHYIVPRHELADRIVALFSKQGIKAIGYRGRIAHDPSSDDLMCLRIDKVEKSTACEHQVQRSCCLLTKKNQETGEIEIEKCRHFDDDDGLGCGFQRMLRRQAQVWVLSAPMLFLPQALLPEPSLIIVDESFHRAGMRGISQKEQELIKLPLDGLRSSNCELARGRDKLRRLLQAQAAKLQDKERIYVRRSAIARGLSAQDCAEILALEKKKLRRPWIHPAISLRQLRDIDTGPTVRALRIILVWEELQHMLEHNIARSGRLELRLSKDGAPELHVRTLRPIHERYRGVPTVIMDATLPGLPILQRFFPSVDVAADLSRVQAPHARVRLLTEAPVTSSHLDVEHNREQLLYYILWRWLEVGRGQALVVTQKEFAEWLAERLPPQIAVRHFHNLSGLDDYSRVRLLISIGRCAPPPSAMEAEAGALSGRAPESVVGPGDWWYPQPDHELAPGVVLKRCDRHPDPLVNANRWQTAEALVLQAIGRARAINRTAENPVEIDILGNLPLPLAIDTVLPWHAPSAVVQMVLLGLVLDSGADLALGWPEIWGEKRAGVRAAQRALARLRAECGENAKLGDTTLLEILYKAVSPSSEQRGNGLRPFRYQVIGRQRWREGCFDPSLVPPQSLPDLLTDRLGPVRVELVRVELAKAA